MDHTYESHLVCNVKHDLEILCSGMVLKHKLNPSIREFANLCGQVVEVFETLPKSNMIDLTDSFFFIVNKVDDFCGLVASDPETYGFLEDGTTLDRVRALMGVDE